MKKSNNKLVCCTCGGTKIQVKAWVDANTDEVLDSCSNGEIEDNWCCDCEEHVEFITWGSYKDKLIIKN